MQVMIQYGKKSCVEKKLGVDLQKLETVLDAVLADETEEG